MVIVREDNNLRGRRRGDVAELVAAGVREAMAAGARCKQVEIVLDELASTRHAMARSNPGDLVVICVDQHAAVMAELESYGHQAQPGARRETTRVRQRGAPTRTSPPFPRLNLRSRRVGSSVAATEVSGAVADAGSW